MVKLSDFPKPVYEPEVAKPDWLCAPCGVTPNSDTLTRANFDALCDRLDDIDPYGDTWEICRFEHFDHTWLENIFINPASKAASLIPEIRDFMATYPCLDDDLWAKYEEEEKSNR